MFTGELAYVRFYDASSNLIDEAYLNDHTDETANSLNEKTLVTRNGNIGSYTGCAAVVQEGGASGTYPPQVRVRTLTCTLLLTIRITLLLVLARI